MRGLSRLFRETANGLGSSVARAVIDYEDFVAIIGVVLICEGLYRLDYKRARFLVGTTTVTKGRWSICPPCSSSRDPQTGPTPQDKPDELEQRQRARGSW